ncbi:23S rRNA (adenine(2030)-N(6))-methyltransferase RlmJ [Luteimonas sp. RD2P54]|uniref:Ribosomal RNA large subunit methyltransferase J n=1 Tax=Luteimonas endophytica TaxID=3042023 RepID=A0ABT6JBC3_9GAMM|nr:23S rRNA (adenine(2030)-N(6))-methyltransferase RlmJ [Luteimonas endophytica]MDH5824127.1 23S rRNA (adenine(2030)-N(6))-methyltransferase RlmJ [Luteimonas endophytica]
MNYRHAFHAGNHADVLKHVVLLALCDALAAKPAPCFALDTHAGRGLYRLDADEAARTGEATDGIGRLLAAPVREPAVARYLAAVAACRRAHGADAYPGSPWLLAHALRPQDRIACCELQPAEADALRAAFRDDPRVAVHTRDGYGAVRALLPPRVGVVRYARGLVLVDPPYELQLEEFAPALAGLREGLQRWPQGCWALWYPIKQRRALAPFQRAAAALPARAALLCELLVRADDSPLRMNGSGLLLLNPPWRLDAALGPALQALRERLGGAGAEIRLEWLRRPA